MHGIDVVSDARVEDLIDSRQSGTPGADLRMIMHARIVQDMARAVRV
ncbi:hypothetical protein SSP35_08_02380 [Streptomyces sp. NBRC 110611]|nr:hypothetical protein SSP35_08_02380 [Streptomyces sp. NBRC 110611]